MIREYNIAIRHRNRRFLTACNQLIQLNNQIEELEARYNRATRDDLRSFRYNLRLRLCSIEGVRNAMFEWASSEAVELEVMMDKFRTWTGVTWTKDLALDEEDKMDVDGILG